MEAALFQIQRNQGSVAIRAELSCVLFGVCLWPAGADRSHPGGRQGVLGPELGAGSLQRRLGPHGSAHLPGHAHAGQLLQDHQGL